jgi:hypothetical protein
VTLICVVVVAVSLLLYFRPLADLP